MTSKSQIINTRTVIIVFLAIFSLVSSYSIFSQTVNGVTTNSNITITSSQEGYNHVTNF